MSNSSKLCVKIYATQKGEEGINSENQDRKSVHILELKQKNAEMSELRILRDKMSLKIIHENQTHLKQKSYVPELLEMKHD